MRRLTLVLLAVLLVTSLFVACKVEMDEPESGTVTLRFRTDDESRSLTASRTALDTSKYDWYYEAKKSDASNSSNPTPATGTTTGKTKVGSNGDLSNAVGPFSLGEWDFTLYGYVESSTDLTDKNLVYKGSVTEYKLEKISGEDVGTIDITVEPQKTDNATGTIVVSKDVKLTANGQEYPATTVQITGSNVTYTGTETSFAAERADLEFGNLSVGSYNVVVSYKDSTNIYATNTIVVNVWNNLTTTVTGTLDEVTDYRKFNAGDGTVTKSQSINKDNSYTYQFTPATTTGGSASATTTVRGSFVSTSESGEAKLTVTTYDAVAASNSTAIFQVLDENENLAAGIDLTLENAKFATDDNGKIKTAIISTTVAKKLKNPAVYHSGSAMKNVTNRTDVDSNGEWWYDNNTGELVFATDSFSSFFVSSESVAINTTTNTAYTTLEAAITAASTGDSITLVGDSDLAAQSGGFTISKTVTIDLNKKTWGIRPKDAWVKINGTGITVTVKNGNISCHRESEASGWTNSILMYKGTLSLENVNLTDNTDSSNGTIYFMAYNFKNPAGIALLEVKDSTLVTSGSGNVINISCLYGMAGGVEIDNSKVIATGGGSAIYAYSADQVIKIRNKSTVKATSQGAYAIVLNGQDGTKHTLEVIDSEVAGDRIGIYCGTSGNYDVVMDNSTISSTSTDASKYSNRAYCVFVDKNTTSADVSTNITLKDVKLALGDTANGVGMYVAKGDNATVDVSGTLTGDSDSSFKVEGEPDIYITKGDHIYLTGGDNLLKAVGEVKENGTITLLGDVTLAESIVPEKSMSLDMNGHNISFTKKTSSGAFCLEKGSSVSFELKNTSETESTVSTSGIGQVAYIKEASTSTLTIGKNIKIESTGGITILSGTLNFSAKLESTLYDSGIQDGNNAKDVVINIEEGAVLKTGNDRPAVILRSKATVNVTNATVEGGAGIAMKLGSLNIAGSTVHGTNNDSNLEDDHGGASPNYDGSAVVIDSTIPIKSATESDTLSITISDSEIKSNYSYAIRQIDEYDSSGSTYYAKNDGTSLSITGESTITSSDSVTGDMKLKTATTTTFNITGKTVTSSVSDTFTIYTVTDGN